MAESNKRRAGSDRAPEALRPPRRPAGREALTTQLGAGTLDVSALLAIADILPVMIAHVDCDYRYKFVNQPLAEWLEQPRQTIIGRTMGEILGSANFEKRRPMLETRRATERAAEPAVRVKVRRREPRRSNS